MSDDIVPIRWPTEAGWWWVRTGPLGFVAGYHDGKYFCEWDPRGFQVGRGGYGTQPEWRRLSLGQYESVNIERMTHHERLRAWDAATSRAV